MRNEDMENLTHTRLNEKYQDKAGRNFPNEPE